MPRIWFISPIYFDAESWQRLRRELQAHVPAGYEPRYVVVDDSAGLDPATTALDAQVIVPPFNLGHQRALVYGLRRLAHEEINDDDLVVTLDGDGEDQPGSLPRLLAPLLEDPSNLRRIALVVVRSRNTQRLSRIDATSQHRAI